MISETPREGVSVTVDNAMSDVVVGAIRLDRRTCGCKDDRTIRESGR